MGAGGLRLTLWPCGADENAFFRNCERIEPCCAPDSTVVVPKASIYFYLVSIRRLYVMTVIFRSIHIAESRRAIGLAQRL
jgi:hypothetical protein